MQSGNQDFKATPAWIISSCQKEEGSSTFAGFKCWRAAVNALCEKFSEIFTGSGVVQGWGARAGAKSIKIFAASSF